jgi:gliding motility-associated lipoprotein GldH
MIKTIRNRITHFACSFLLLGLMTSCGESYIYDQVVEIPEETWTYAYPLDFEFEVNDTTNLYNLFIEVKHQKEYPNQNAYAKLLVTMPDGSTQNREVSFELATPEGEWVGKCSGDYCSSKLLYKKATRFTQMGKFKMHFEQYSRQDSLTGLSSLRVMLQEAELESEEK